MDSVACSVWYRHGQEHHTACGGYIAVCMHGASLDSVTDSSGIIDGGRPVIDYVSACCDQTAGSGIDIHIIHCIETYRFGSIGVASVGIHPVLCYVQISSDGRYVRIVPYIDAVITVNSYRGDASSAAAVGRICHVPSCGNEGCNILDRYVVCIDSVGPECRLPGSVIVCSGVSCYIKLLGYVLQCQAVRHYSVRIAYCPGSGERYAGYLGRVYAAGYSKIAPCANTVCRLLIRLTAVLEVDDSGQVIGPVIVCPCENDVEIPARIDGGSVVCPGHRTVQIVESQGS